MLSPASSQSLSLDNLNQRKYACLLLPRNLPLQHQGFGSALRLTSGSPADISDSATPGLHENDPVGAFYDNFSRRGFVERVREGPPAQAAELLLGCRETRMVTAAEAEAWGGHTLLEMQGAEDEEVVPAVSGLLAVLGTVASFQTVAGCCGLLQLRLLRAFQHMAASVGSVAQRLADFPRGLVSPLLLSPLLLSRKKHI